MTIIIPRSATWIIWPVVLALASTLAFAMGWSAGVDNGRSWAARELEPEIRANADHINALSDRLVYLTERMSLETLASFYGEDHRGKLTASGVPFNPDEFTAASPWLPFGSKWWVTRISTGQSVTITINDRGPNMRLGRGLDLSRAAAEAIGMISKGVVRVTIAPAL